MIYWFFTSLTLSIKAQVKLGSLKSYKESLYKVAKIKVEANWTRLDIVEKIYDIKKTNKVSSRIHEEDEQKKFEIKRENKL